ncbi:MAG TPA: hypothetical protein VFH56_06815 [Acidimicrobiales bacterium]|nr:hypothetical protein [Acidimicrobiales bacterium]
MRYRSLTVAACLAAATALAMPASAATAAASGTGHTITQTDHQHGTWTEPGDTDFCTGATIAPTITGNEVEHVTFFPGGDEVWGTFTEAGTATALVGDLLYSGRITVWGNFNVNERNQNNTFTATFNLTATDANGVTHTEVGHEVAHVGWNAVSQEPVVSFDKMYITCT